MNWVPVTVTVYVPPVPEQLRVLVCEGAITTGFRVQLNPLLGETDAESAMLDENPLIGFTEIVEFAATFGVVVSMVGLAKIWKSTTWTVIVWVV